MGQDQDIYKKYNIHRNPVMLVLNKFSWTLTTGYSRTTNKHELTGYYFYQDSDGQYILPNSEPLGAQFQGYSDWFNTPTLGDVLPLQNPTIPEFFLNNDTANIGFEGISRGIPITFQVHFNFMKKFRIGAGYSWEKHYVKELSPTNYKDIIRPYQPNFESTTYSRLFGTLGYQFYSYYEHLFVVELQVGKIKSRSEFNPSAVKQNLYYNFGVSIEKQLSEYFRIIFKPSLDIRSYKVAIPSGTEISINQPTMLFQVGVSINIPEIPRSPISNDHIQVKHVITDPSTGRLIEVRGQPITKWQNPKVGQNHRKLFQYKRRNKKKLNPY